MLTSVEFSSVTQSCPTLCDPVDLSMPGLPVHRQLPKPAQTNVHWISDDTISSSVIPFSSCAQSFPASGSFQMSQFFASGSQSIGVSVSESVLSMNIQDRFPLGWTGWISLQSKRLSRVLPTPQFKSINSSVLSYLYSLPLTYIHDHLKNHSFD